MKNRFPFKIGIMQGRLLPKVKNRYQAFPIKDWKKEFFLSKKLGLDLIEFIFDKGDVNLNPLMTEIGVGEIREIIRTSEIDIKSICADYFMYHPLHKKNSIQEIQILNKLIINSSILGISNIVIPCVDNSSLNTENKIQNFIHNIKKVISLAEMTNINLAIETDLEPTKFLNLINNINSKNITINYDTGNSAAHGFDCTKELKILNQKITSIHIKDRFFQGESVFLGSGDFDFDNFFNDLINHNIKPSYVIIQAYRDEEGVEIFKKQLKWLINKLKFYFVKNL